VRLERATRVALVAILLAQAVAVVMAEPWPEGAVLLILSRDHGVTEGDLPAVALIIAAALTALLSHPRMLRRR